MMGSVPKQPASPEYRCISLTRAKGDEPRHDYEIGVMSNDYENVVIRRGFGAQAVELLHVPLFERERMLSRGLASEAELDAATEAFGRSGDRADQEGMRNALRTALRDAGGVTFNPEREGA